MRSFLVALFVIVTWVVVATGAWADDRSPQVDDQPLIVQPPENWIGTEIKVTDLPLSPQAPDAAPAADQCSAATPLELSFRNTADGSGTLTNLFSQEATDPVLSCMFGAPTSPQGYRTAWYKLVAGDTSTVTITTEGTDYDTVLAVFTGSCDALQSLACSDDFRSFQSSATFPVTRGHTYYIQVADYHSGAPGAAFLQLSAVLREGGERWNQASTMPFGGITRHALVSDGPEMFIIGGQTRVAGGAEISNRFLLYNALGDSWRELSDIPGPGLSNTTAVRLGRKIYIPGGFNGDQSNYANTHYVYDIATDYWEQIASIPQALLPNGEMFAWSAAVPAPGHLAYYVTGGITNYPSSDPDPDPDAVVINNVYRFVPATNQWEPSPPMLAPRYAHTAAWVFAGNRGLCVAGGLDVGEDDEGDPVTVLLTTGECFNPTTGSWQPTGDLNFPRYNAGSAIGPDGNWYIFGGLDANGGVPETEFYNPLTNSWQVLGGEFSLGGLPQNPARVWPRGAFWGDRLFVFGGNTPPREYRVISAVEKMSIGAGFAPLAKTIVFPLVASLGAENLLNNAIGLPPNTPLSGNFSSSTQFYNPYFFDWPAFGRARIVLSNIPEDSNFNISVYDSNKVLRGRGNTTLYGGEKTVSLTLAPGRYYVVAERIFPKDLPNPAVYYRLTLSRQ
ncbi:MAG TPA: kelch repeat-containing protein [Promineifilum sp.]|nr:kelch repeat-containing protein [Promineifilum sp.]HRQ12701.1 kelch repeat-containing protein [Promineifilum sp.]